MGVNAIDSFQKVSNNFFSKCIASLANTAHRYLPGILNFDGPLYGHGDSSGDEYSVGFTTISILTHVD